jgi:PPP family 3-phenylpropionic acid transporter
LGFAAAAVSFGWLTGGMRPFLVVPAALGVLLVNAAISSLIPVPGASRRPLSMRISRVLRRPEVFLLLASGFLMQASHGAYIGFFSLVLEEVGYTSRVVGLAWAWAIAAEVVMLLSIGRLINNLGTRHLLALSVSVAAVRWATYAVTLHPAAIIVGQALHAFTYAGFHVAAVQTVYRLFPPGTRATGQALYSGWTFGAGMMAGTAASGLIKDYFGPAGMFWAACALALGALALIGLGAGQPGAGDRRGVPIEPAGPATAGSETLRGPALSSSSHPWEGGERGRRE